METALQTTLRVLFPSPPLFARPGHPPLLTPSSNLVPGGWIELLEQDPQHCCDDGTMPADSFLAKNHKLIVDAGNSANRPLTMIYDMQRMVEETGFVNVHKTDYKIPVGEWPKQQVYKDAGRVALNQMKNGMEGW